MPTWDHESVQALAGDHRDGRTQWTSGLAAATGLADQLQNGH
jgi:hypothetical protein